MESKFHSESGDLNLATCLAASGESSNMWWDGKVSAQGEEEAPCRSFPKKSPKGMPLAREILMT